MNIASADPQRQVPKESVPEKEGRHRLRLLSYNIQTGVTTRHYRHYVTQSWKHVLPHPERFDNLNRIADLIHGYDLVGLQEVDAGSLRSGFVNLTEYLAQRADYPYWYDQTNRRVGGIARHAIGMLSRYRPTEITEHKLPGRIPGRGALLIRFGTRDDSLVLLILHLALSKGARMRQLGYVGDLVNRYRNVILMGDLNCRSDSPEMNYLIGNTLMREPIHGLHTFPSWRPARNIDHILVTPTLQVMSAVVLDCTVSDHLPVAMEIAVPGSVQLAH
ncbi:MAG TPA: endonuclease/exonuclease/phosphatase family protein [Gammaproteobacteria bacterium]|nr:endonuclease/exonuclease/phosphatase family protein [Gammaproteobacteria bacterium]